MNVKVKKKIRLSLPKDVDIDSKYDRRNETEFIFEQLKDAITIDVDGCTLDDETFKDIINEHALETIDAASFEIMDNIYEKTLESYQVEGDLTPPEVFLNQMLVENNLPMPSKFVIYTIDEDLYPAVDNYLKGKVSKEFMIAEIGATKRLNSIGLTFETKEDRIDFAKYINECINDWQIEGRKKTMLKKIANIFKGKMPAIETFKMITDGSKNSVKSVNRILRKILFTYDNKKYGIIPFRVNQLIDPVNITVYTLKDIKDLSNIEVKRLLNDNENAINRFINLKTNEQMQSLTELKRADDKERIKAERFKKNGCDEEERKSQPIRIKYDSTKSRMNIIYKILKKMANVRRSENIYKTTKMTYAMPNRRDPDDFNKKGKIMTSCYKPDIHVYIDSSGSMTVDNYKNAVLNCVKLAKDMDVNIYINTFSHYLAPQVKLRVKGRSMKSILKDMEKVPTATGGTNFKNIWEYINKSKKRTNELSIVITDFAYIPPNGKYKHPKNLFYIPCENISIGLILDDANTFKDAMQYIDPSIQKKIII